MNLSSKPILSSNLPLKELRRVRQDGDSGRADGCVVCAGNPIEVLIEPCGHVAVCQDCVKRMHRDGSLGIWNG